MSIIQKYFGESRGQIYADRFNFGLMVLVGALGAFILACYFDWPNEERREASPIFRARAAAPSASLTQQPTFSADNAYVHVNTASGTAKVQVVVNSPTDDIRNKVAVGKRATLILAGQTFATTSILHLLSQTSFLVGEIPIHAAVKLSKLLRDGAVLRIQISD